MLLRGYPLQKKIEFPMSSNNFSFSLVICCGALLLSGVDTNSALALAVATVIKRPEAIHVPGSAKSVNLDESIVSTKLENDNVVTVVLTGKRNLEEYVQFSRRANFPASLPLTFVDALTNIVDQVEIRARIFGDCLRFPFDPGDCFHLCSCLFRCFLEVKEVLNEEVLIRFGNRALVGQIISWNFPIFMALSIYYNTTLNILGIGKSRLYNSNFERLGQGGRSIADNLQWWLTGDTIFLLAIFSTQLTTHLLDDLSASRSHLYHPLDIIFSQDHSHNGCSLKEKKYSCLVDWRSKLRELKYSLKFINKLGNAINVDRDQIQLASILHGSNIASDALLQFWHCLAMKMILELKDGLLQLGSILSLIVALSVFNVVSFTWFILDVLGEPIHESSILSVVDKASGKQGRYMRNRLNVITLLVLKAADRKFTDIGLKNTAHVLVFSLQYDFVKHEFWMHKFKDAYWSSSEFWKTFTIPFMFLTLRTRKGLGFEGCSSNCNGKIVSKVVAQIAMEKYGYSGLLNFTLT
ncbi:hypothetical protein MTR67_047682 [Solanum verrucosum]|uniref:Uncharacterized protein n=1 Tax=Solanum verrucosum TaxID=315347 RepID=A0AAF0UXI4_SOLVR|nr:hypothetical protein MTR67_047682 [Solanum verrucosum]